MNASSASPRWRNMSVNPLTRAARFSFPVMEASIRIPSDIGPPATEDGRFRLTGGVYGVSSAQTDGAGLVLGAAGGGTFADATVVVGAAGFAATAPLGGGAGLLTARLGCS